MLVLDAPENTNEYRLDDKRVQIPYGPDMFIQSYRNIIDCGYSVAVDADGTPKALIKELGTTYEHRYIYSGRPDLTFLDGYDCICLNGCNEFSVEICRKVLQFWKGDRLVLLGAEWNDLVGYLPDIPGVDCFYDPNMSESSLQELVSGRRPLYVTTGLPHQEKTDRLNEGLMFYDEIMALTFLFSDCRKNGDANPDKKFYVIDVPYNNLGLFGIFGKANTISRYVKSRGMIPIVNLTKSTRSMYSDFAGDEIWSKFYNQPEGYTIKDVQDSRHVYYSPCFYNGSILCHIMEQEAGEVSLTWPDGIYNQKVLDLLAEGQKNYLPFPEKTLGVLARGTDYANSKLPNHFIHAEPEMLFEKIDETLRRRPELKYIYVATEDESYCSRFRERYGERLYCTNQRRFTTKQNEMLAQMHRASAQPVKGYTLGTDYILSIGLLAQCRALIASGGCAGYYRALEENRGKWDESDIFLFDLGLTPEERTV